MNFKHIIFDCDGVLVDSEIVAAETMVNVLNSFGHATTLNHYLSKYTGQTFKGIFDQFKIDSIVDVQELIRNVEQTVYANVKEIDGIVELVKNIELPKSVVSNSGPSQIKHAVHTLGLENDFLNQFSASSVDKPKPSPDVYEFALRNLDLNSSDCLVIEDSISGCTAALSANLTVIGFCGGSHITNKHSNQLRDAGVLYIADNVQDLASLISDLTKKELG